MARFSLYTLLLFTAIAALLAGAGLAGNEWCMATLNTLIPLLFGYAFLTVVWLKQGDPFWRGFLAFGLAYWLIQPGLFDDTGDIFHQVYTRFEPGGMDMGEEIKRYAFLDEVFRKAGFVGVAVSGGLFSVWATSKRKSQ